MVYEVLRINEVTYKKEDVTMLKNFNLSVLKGEILGLLPIDLYGLDELIEIIQHNSKLFYGYVYYMDRCVNSWKGSTGSTNRVTVVQNGMSLIKEQSVLTNIFVLRQGFKQKILDKKLLKKQLKPFFEEIGTDISPDALVESLSAYEKVVVEILKGIIAGSHLIILREVASTIGEEEFKKLKKILEYYSSKGISFIYISLHFEELRQVCKKVAVMISSTIAVYLEGDNLIKGTPKALYTDYYEKVDKKVKKPYIKENKKVLAELKRLGKNNEIDICIYEGECLVIQNHNISIYDEIIEMLKGERKGNFYLYGKEISFSDSKIAFVRSVAVQSMIFEDLSVFDNLVIGANKELEKRFWNKKIKKLVIEEYIREFGNDIFNKELLELSAIDKLELIYGRVMLRKPKVAFLEQPYRSTDLNSRYRLWELQKKLLKKGITLVIIAVNMADALTIADRVVKIGVDGRIREYYKDEFAKMPGDLPWVEVYENSNK